MDMSLFKSHRELKQGHMEMSEGVVAVCKGFTWDLNEHYLINFSFMTSYSYVSGSILI